ncbi:MAG: YhhN-like protein [Clostridia bacterium]|nr:YhhN-like protein [Clostridia bacterium]
MSVFKKFLILSIILFIFLIYLLNTLLDFSRLFNLYALYNLFPNEILKRVNVLLAAALVWLAGKDTINRQDNRLMKYVFFSIGCGEIFFLLAKPVIAIGFFIICQSLLIARHTIGLRAKLIQASSTQWRKLIISGIVLMVLLFTGVVVLQPLLRLNILILIGGIYGIILSISLWAGFANYILGLFPYKNSKLAALGMLCFYFCDVLVGLDGLLSYSTAWIVASSFIWVFYTPALTLLALSGYRNNIKSYSSARIANI